MLPCLLSMILNTNTMEIKKINKRQLLDNVMLVRVNDQQKTLIQKSAKLNKVPYSEVLRNAINDFFKVDENEEDQSN